jgi:hypothetical protein
MSNKQKFFSVLRYIALNGIFAVSIYFGFFAPPNSYTIMTPSGATVGEFSDEASAHANAYTLASGTLKSNPANPAFYVVPVTTMNDGFENLALFIGWITGIVGTIVLIGITLDKQPSAKGELIESLMRQNPSVVPFTIDLVFDIGVLVAFVWTGHYVLVFFYLMSIYAGKEIRDLPKDIMLNKLKSQQS